eukprot:UN1480
MLLPTRAQTAGQHDLASFNSPSKGQGGGIIIREKRGRFRGSAPPLFEAPAATRFSACRKSTAELLPCDFLKKAEALPPMSEWHWCTLVDTGGAGRGGVIRGSAALPTVAWDRLPPATRP